MRILVCGGRDYYYYSKVNEALEEEANEVWLEDPEEEVVIIQGGATGADFLAKVWALDEYRDMVFHEEYPADWKLHGRKAGPIRNQKMLDEGKPDLVIAFPGGKGTADMITRAKKANVPVRIID